MRYPKPALDVIPEDIDNSPRSALPVLYPVRVPCHLQVLHVPFPSDVMRVPQVPRLYAPGSHEIQRVPLRCQRAERNASAPGNYVISSRALELFFCPRFKA